MKYTLIVAILSLIAAPTSQAQLAGTLNQVVSPVRPIIDRTSYRLLIEAMAQFMPFLL